MVYKRARASLRTAPVIEVAREGAVRLALIGGLAILAVSLAQVATGDSAGFLSMAGALPTIVLALWMRRKERPNVILLLAWMCGFTIAVEVYAAWTNQTEYVAGIGTEVVVFGIGVLAVFIAREHPVPVAVGFLFAALVPVVVSQIHLNGASMEISTDMLVVTSVAGTLMYLIIRVLDSLSESHDRYSDLANVIPVATYEFDLTRVLDALRHAEQEQPFVALSSARQVAVVAELMPRVHLSFFNDTARDMVGYYGTWDEFGAEENSGELLGEAVKVLLEIWQGKVVGTGEFTARRRDGVDQDFIYRWVLGESSGIGSPVRLVLSAMDVTRLRQAEAALAQQLRERDQFVASVSHELRTPLTSIMGLTEELVDRPQDFDSRERRELLEIVASETRDVVDIVEDLLVTARAEAGQLQIALKPCDLTAEMQRVAELMGGTASSGEPVWASADPGRLRQVMRNLLTNAQRHGGPNVRMSVEALDTLAVFEIRDNGMPLPHSERERIFEPYERVTGEEVVGSVGLGLHVARLLARLMGGDLSYNHDGIDTVFRLELQLVPAPATLSGKQAS
jgi:signal transduction histidine kinase